MDKTKFKRIFPKLRISYTLLSMFRANPAIITNPETVAKYLLGVQQGKTNEMQWGSYVHEFMEKSPPKGLQYMLGEDILKNKKYETEKKLTYSLSDKCDLVGVLDLLTDDCFVDYKTGHTPPDNSQLEFYSMLLDKNNMKRTKAMFLNVDMVVKGKSMKYMFEDSKLQEADDFERWEYVRSLITSAKEEQDKYAICTLTRLAKLPDTYDSVITKSQKVEKILLKFIEKDLLQYYKQFRIEGFL
jgi:hypothetical protein